MISKGFVQGFCYRVVVGGKPDVCKLIDGRMGTNGCFLMDERNPVQCGTKANPVQFSANERLVPFKIPRPSVPPPSKPSGETTDAEEPVARRSSTRKRKPVAALDPAPDKAAAKPSRTRPPTTPKPPPQRLRAKKDPAPTVMKVTPKRTRVASARPLGQEAARCLPPVPQRRWQ
jgi:hypothetical protein